MSLLSEREVEAVISVMLVMMAVALTVTVTEALEDRGRTTE